MYSQSLPLFDPTEMHVTPSGRQSFTDTSTFFPTDVMAKKKKIKKKKIK